MKTKKKSSKIFSVWLFILYCLVLTIKCSYAQSAIYLKCENLGIAWDVQIHKDLELIFTSMKSPGAFSNDSVWKIVHFGDRYIKGNFVYKDKENNQTKVSDRLVLTLDRHDSNLYWGRSENEVGPFSCQKIDQKF